MKQDFVIALYGKATGWLRELIDYYGTVHVLESGEPPEETDVVIIDCEHLDHSLEEKFLHMTLKQDRKLCLLNMNDSDRQHLHAATKRQFSTFTEGVMVCKDSTMRGGFRFSIIPKLTRLENEDGEAAVSYLNRRVFTELCGGGGSGPPPHLHRPPETYPHLWDTLNIYQWQASRKTLLNTGKKTYTYELFPGLEQTYAINSVGYFYYSNGQNGDNKYHMIVLTKFTDLSPYSICSGPAGTFGGVYQVTTFAKHKGVPVGIAGASTPSPQNPRTHPTWGNIIETSFGARPNTRFPLPPEASNVPQPMLFVCGYLDSNPNSAKTIPVEPVFFQVLGQEEYPGIGNFSIIADDGPESNSTTFSSKPASKLHNNILGQFSVVNYFVFDGDPGARTYIIDIFLEITIGVNRSHSDGGGGVGTEYDHTIPVDLVEATKMQSPTMSSSQSIGDN